MDTANKNIDKKIIGQDQAVQETTSEPPSRVQISISYDQWQRLQEMANQLGISLDKLVEVGLEQLLHEPDEDFKRVADYVMEKNAELLRRLA